MGSKTSRSSADVAVSPSFEMSSADQQPWKATWDNPIMAGLVEKLTDVLMESDMGPDTKAAFKEVIIFCRSKVEWEASRHGPRSALGVSPLHGMLQTVDGKGSRTAEEARGRPSQSGFLFHNRVKGFSPNQKVSQEVDKGGRSDFKSGRGVEFRWAHTEIGGRKVGPHQTLYESRGGNISGLADVEGLFGLVGRATHTCSKTIGSSLAVGGGCRARMESMVLLRRGT